MQTAPRVSTLKRLVKVTHPFHPLFGQEFELVGYLNSWKKECVQLLNAGGTEFSLPLDWTDAGDVDPFLLYSQGRSHFRVDELVLLSDLIAAIASTSKAEQPENM